LLSTITQTLGKCGGGPCIRGMKIRVSGILETLADNITPTQILADFLIWSQKTFKPVCFWHLSALISPGPQYDFLVECSIAS